MPLCRRLQTRPATSLPTTRGGFGARSPALGAVELESVALLLGRHRGVEMMYNRRNAGEASSSEQRQGRCCSVLRPRWVAWARPPPPGGTHPWRWGGWSCEGAASQQAVKGCRAHRSACGRDRPMVLPRLATLPLRVF
jgi:hypothetical protein